MAEQSGNVMALSAFNSTMNRLRILRLFAATAWVGQFGELAAGIEDDSASRKGAKTEKRRLVNSSRESSPILDSANYRISKQPMHFGSAHHTKNCSTAPVQNQTRQMNATY